MILVDSNVPMYVVGTPHPNRDRALALVTRLLRDGEELVTDVEVYQEILHRYASIRRFATIDIAFTTLHAIAPDALTFGVQEIRDAHALMQSVDGLSARDALHVAVMQRAGIDRILSFDRGFDRCPGITRLS